MAEQGLPDTLRFPDGFYWGVATSAYQIEGAADADGKGKSIWDKFAHTPGKMKNNETGDVANDHYYRYKEDVALMKEMGVKAYRFSMAWSRIFPEGSEEPNLKGIDFYSRLVDELLAAGIEPFATLYHWDLPQALQDRGGWQSREIPKAFGEYAGYVAQQLSDRVRHFFTINEFTSFVETGYRGAELEVQGQKVVVEQAPGLKLAEAELSQVRHHAVLGHGMAVQAIRAMGRSGTQCGPAEVMNVAIPAIATPEHIQAAELAARDLNARYLDVMLDGKYSDRYLQSLGDATLKFTDADLQIISSPVDFVGINVYRPVMYVMASDQAPEYQSIPLSESHPKMDAPWHVLAPEVLYWAPRLLYSIWKPPAIYITENGCAAIDKLAADGNVYDSDRVMYVRNELAHLQRATAEGVPVKGNSVWSMMDNLEWADGYDSRFGLVYVDFETQQRIPKLSASYFRQVAAHNAVL